MRFIRAVALLLLRSQRWGLQPPAGIERRQDMYFEPGGVFCETVSGTVDGDASPAACGSVSSALRGIAGLTWVRAPARSPTKSKIYVNFLRSAEIDVSANASAAKMTSAGPMGEMSRPVAQKPNCTYLQHWVWAIRASSMLDIAAGILVLTSVGIFVAHAVETYRTQ
jgi:hypothetical protein